MNRFSRPKPAPLVLTDDHGRTRPDPVSLVESIAPRDIPVARLARDPLWGEFSSAFESLFEVLRDPDATKRDRQIARRDVQDVSKRVVARARRERERRGS